MNETPTPAGTAIQAVWASDATKAPDYVNQFVIASGAQLSAETRPEGSVYVVFGHASPPVFVSDEDIEIFRQRTNGRVEIDVRAAVVMTEGRALELYRTLGRHLGLEVAP